MGWSINNGATINANTGVASFPANTSSSPKTYIVTYSDGDCTCTYTVTQPGTSPTPTECTSWGDWGDWQTATVGCSGGDSSAEVCRYRTCLTDPTKTESDCETVYFSTTSCNTGGTITVYNQNGKKVEQSGGCSCGGGGCSDATVTLSGLDGNAEVTINGSPNYWGNGSHTYSFPSGINSVSISMYKSGCSFSPSSGTLTCGDNFSTTASCGGGGSCTCSDLTITSSISFGATGGTRTIGYTPTDCPISVQSQPSWLTLTDNGNGTFTATAGSHTGDRREGAIIWSFGGVSNCSSTYVSQDGSGGSCEISYTSTGKTGNASFSYGVSTKTSSSGSFTASGTGGTITASANSGYYVQPSSANVPCDDSQKFEIFKDVACTVYGGNTGTSVTIDYHPSSAPSATVAFSIDYDYNGTRYTHTEYGKTVSAADSGKNNFTVTLPRGTAINNTLTIVSKSFTNSLDYNTWEHYIW